jgi:TRAP transporter TAXI family solute receptor
LVKHDKKIMVLMVISILILSVFVLGCTQTAKQYTMATGGSAGTYYPIGIGIAQAVNNESAGFNLSVETSGASVANCRLVQNNSVDFALVQNDVAYSALNGVADFSIQGKLEKISGVACLYPETIQLITLANSGIKNVTDLKGKNVVMGDRGSGSWYNALEILEAYGLNETDVNPSAVKLSQAAEMMKNGQVDAAFWTGGAPTTAITDLATTHDIYIVPISGEARAILLTMSPFYANQTLLANTYRSVTEPVETVSVMSMIIAYKDLPTDDVYNLLKAMYDGSKPIDQYPHAVAQNITKAKALTGMSIPLHTGAEKYFKEQGLI